MDELISRQVPHATEAEQAVLGSILIDERCIPRVMEELQPEDFYLRQNREIFDAICALFNFSESVDPVTVLEKMKHNGSYDENVTYDYVKQLMDVTPTAANVERYIDIVKDTSLLRRIMRTAEEMIALVQEGSGSATDILRTAEQRIYDIRQGRDLEGLEHISKVIFHVYDRLNELVEQDDQIPGLPTGLADLDTVIAGLNKSDLILLAARPGVGKTSLALNILLNVGKNRSKQAMVFFSLEMSRIQLAMRLISSECFVELKKLITGRLQQEDWDNIANAAASLSQTRIYIDDNPMLSVSDMMAKCRRVDNLGLVVIDYLQLMTTAGGTSRPGENRQQVVSDISRALKIMAKKLNVPVLCLSQLSRANEARTNKRPMLSDLRESGAIEQDADIVMFLYREGYYDKEVEDPNMTECIIAKNRHGETKTVPLQWLPEFTTFRSIDTSHEAP